MGNRFHAGVKVVRGGGKLKIDAFVWFRVYDNGNALVAEVARLKRHHEQEVEKAIGEGVALCRLRCEIDGDITILMAEEIQAAEADFKAAEADRQAAEAELEAVEEELAKLR